MLIAKIAALAVLIIVIIFQDIVIAIKTFEIKDLKGQLYMHENCKAEPEKMDEEEFNSASESF